MSKIDEALSQIEELKAEINKIKAAIAKPSGNTAPKELAKPSPASNSIAVVESEGVKYRITIKPQFSESNKLTVYIDGKRKTLSVDDALKDGEILAYLVENSTVQHTVEVIQ